jgi:hypothetical protein
MSGDQYMDEPQWSDHFDNDRESGAEDQRLSAPSWAECRKRDRRERIASVRAGKVAPFYVAAIATGRRYGGPEEGGWWYDVTTIEAVRKAWDVSTGLKHARELREEHPTCPRGRHSVIGREDIEVRVFRSLDDLPTEGPYGRPQYE